MKVLFLTGSAPIDDAAAMDRLAQAATDLQITLVDSPSSALAEIRRVRGFHALMTSPTVPQADALALIVSLRRDAVPIAIVPILTEAQQSFFASAVASGADDVLLLRGEHFVNLRETITRVRQSPHLRPAADRRRLRTLYAGKDPLVWNLLGQIPFVSADRATVSPDGVTPVRVPGSADSALRCDVVVIDEPPGEAHALQILKSVKAQASDLPVVMLTAPAAGDVETAALDLGADDIVVKSGVFRRRLAATLRHAHQRLELVEQHATLRTRADRLRQIVETMPAGLTIVSGDGTVLAINAAAQALVGAAKPTDIVGHPFVSLVIAEHRSDVTDVLHAITEGERSQVVFDVLGLDGVRRTVDLHGVVLERDARGHRGVIAVLQTPMDAAESAANDEEIQAELDEARQALQDAEDRRQDHDATLTSERAANLDIRRQLDARQLELSAALEQRARMEAALDAMRLELQQNIDAHAWERTSWENTRRELLAKLTEAQQAASAGADVQATVATVSEDLRHVTETLEWERGAWEADRRRLTERIEALEAAVAAHVRVEADAALASARADLQAAQDTHAAERHRLETALDALRSELHRTVEAHGGDRTRWEQERRELSDRVRELAAVAAGRTEIESALGGARADLREATNTLASERANWDTARRHHEHQIRSLEEVRAADRDEFDRERLRLQAAVTELHQQIDTARATRAGLERALGETVERANQSVTVLKAEHAAALASLVEEHRQTTLRLEGEMATLRADRSTLTSELASADASHRWVLDCGLVGMCIMTIDGKLVRCNDTFGRMFGYLDANDALVRTGGQPFPGTAGRAQLDATLLSRRQLPYIDSCLERIDGRPLRVVECATLVNDGADGQALVERVFIEMTLRSELEERLQQARRLEEVGRLATAITPDIDALVSSIQDPGARLSQEAGVSGPARQHADTILARAKRATDLVRQLLKFSRKQSQPPAPIDLNVVVRRVEPLLARLIGSHVDFEVELGPTDAVLASDDDLEQLVTTLVVSVRDLLPVGGSVRLETATGRLDWTSGDGHDVRSGPTITLAVTAAGYGVQAPQTTASLELLAQRCGGSIELLQHEGRVGLQVHIPYFSRASRRTAAGAAATLKTEPSHIDG